MTTHSPHSWHREDEMGVSSSSSRAAILQEILEATSERVARAKRCMPPSEAVARARCAPPCRDFVGALQRAPDRPPAVIAELKKASPSRGLIRADFEPAPLAEALEEAGAAALSVLTEPDYFQGSPEILREVSDLVDIPVLRKDFIIDEYQLLEARIMGADAVLLIAAALSPEHFRSLLDAAGALGLGALCEVHNEGELDVVLAAGACLVGINSRDLKTFHTDLATTARLLRRLPAGVVGVAESGIRTAQDVRALRAEGAQAFLVGETLMRADDPGAALHALLHGEGDA